MTAGRVRKPGRGSPPPLRFAKMHALGNDFMIVDLVTQPVQPSPQRIRAWGDRRTGVGFDQFLAVLPPDDPDADFRYAIFNADGSAAEQCGNGARCFARFVVDQGLTTKRELALQTAGGRIFTSTSAQGRVQVDMGAPSIEPEDVPFVANGVGAADSSMAKRVSYAIEVDGEPLRATPVGLGNPHAVLFVDDVFAAPVERIGSALQRHPQFPQQVNVGFLQVVDRCFGRLRVYERGVGETRACGSGACAAMVAGRLHERFDERVKLSLPGGNLQLVWQGVGASAKLSGDAELVYNGRIEL